MKIICKNPKNYNLTLDKEYEVINEDTDMYTIKNDLEKEVNFSKDLFKTTSITNIEITFSNDTPDSINIRFDVGNNHETIKNIFKIDTVAGNCGVQGINGINVVYHYLEYGHQDRAKEFFKKILDKLFYFLEEEIYTVMVVFSTNDTHLEVWEVLDEICDVYTEKECINPDSNLPIRLWIKYLHPD
jgi:hypothetical protein